MIALVQSYMITSDHSNGNTKSTEN